MYSQQQYFSTIIQPQTYELSFSPLLIEAQNHKEKWRMSSFLHHTANQQESDGRKLLHMPSIYSNESFPTKMGKALPDIPISNLNNYIPQDPYQVSPAYFPHVQQVYNNYAQSFPCTPMPAANPEYLSLANVVYNHHQQQQQVPYLESSDYSFPSSSSSSSSPSSSFNELDEPPSTSYSQQQGPPKIEQNKNVRQITVKSINNDYRVWITVDPKETGESIAEKIHIIATFRTRKITSVTTASGRKVSLNKTPVFKHWEDMDDFENGETWTVTWGPLERSFMDKMLSRFIET